MKFQKISRTTAITGDAWGRGLPADRDRRLRAHRPQSTGGLRQPLPLASGAAPAARARLGLGECDGAHPAAWEFAANGALTMNGLCLDAPASGQPALAACDAWS